MNNHAKNCIGIIVSIGIGKNDKAKRFKGEGLLRYWNYLNFAKAWATEANEKHGMMLDACRDSSFKYYRLSVDQGLQSMKLDEWRAPGPLRKKLGRWIGGMRSQRSSKNGMSNFGEENLEETTIAGNKIHVVNDGVSAGGEQPINHTTQEDQIQ